MIFTSEQVSMGHPDKVCDQISDKILTYCLQNDKNARVACECMIKDYTIIVAGEITTDCSIPYANLVRDVLKDIGYTDTNKYDIQLLVGQQSSDIALGTNDEVGGAGDQGMMFGYATNETPEMLPIPYVLATAALKKLDELRRSEKFMFTDGTPMILEDAKSQVSFDYDNNRITTFLISTQHDEDTDEVVLKSAVTEIMMQVAEEYGFNTDFDILINPTGRFVIGGSHGDCGLTGRKIIADTYGGMCRHGGGAFSGKDPSKVDRSGAYMCRKLARDIVNAELATKAEVQIAYAIGVAEPVSICVNTFGTGTIPDNEIADKIRQDYDLTPKGIIEFLDLKNVDYYALTSKLGHFGKPELPWEK